MKKMKAIFHQVTFDRSGGPLTLLTWAGFLRELGVEAIFYTNGGDLVPEAEAAGFEVNLARTGYRRPSPVNVAELSHLARRTGADLLLGASTVPALECTLAGCALGLGVVPCLNIVRHHHLDSAWRFPSLPPMVTVSGSLAEEWTKRYGYPEGSLRAIPARFDLDEIRARSAVPIAPGEWPEEGSAPVAVLLRRSTPLKAKGVLAGLDFYEELARKVDNLKLLIVGKGSEIGRTQARAREIDAAGGAKRIFLLGERSDAPAFLEKADLVFTSERGATESLLLGTPTVVVGLDGMVDLVDKKNIDRFWRDNFLGRGAPAAPRKELLEKTARLLNDPARARRLGRSGRKWIEERADGRRGAEELRRIFDEALEMQPSPWERTSRFMSAIGAAFSYHGVNLRRAAKRRRTGSALGPPTGDHHLSRRLRRAAKTE